MKFEVAFYMMVVFTADDPEVWVYTLEDGKMHIVSIEPVEDIFR